VFFRSWPDNSCSGGAGDAFCYKSGRPSHGGLAMPLSTIPPAAQPAPIFTLAAVPRSLGGSDGAAASMPGVLTRATYAVAILEPTMGDGRVDVGGAPASSTRRAVAGWLQPVGPRRPELGGRRRVADGPDDVRVEVSADDGDPRGWRRRLEHGQPKQQGPAAGSGGSRSQMCRY